VQRGRADHEVESAALFKRRRPVTIAQVGAHPARPASGVAEGTARYREQQRIGVEPDHAHVGEAIERASRDVSRAAREVEDARRRAAEHLLGDVKHHTEALFAPHHQKRLLDVPAPAPLAVVGARRARYVIADDFIHELTPSLFSS
jgi:hypothetical protein